MSNKITNLFPALVARTKRVPFINDRYIIGVYTCSMLTMEAAAKLSLYLHQNFIQISLVIKSPPPPSRGWNDKIQSYEEKTIFKASDQLFSQKLKNILHHIYCWYKHRYTIPIQYQYMNGTGTYPIHSRHFNDYKFRYSEKSVYFNVLILNNKDIYNILRQKEQCGIFFLSWW